MDLFHFHLASGNFGDDLNLWLWDEILPGWREALPGHLLIGVGTLINDKLPRGVPKVVLGSGVGYGRLPDADLMAECRFVAVRGPRSAAALGLPSETGIVDPAVLIADLPAFQNIPKSGRPVFVPHVSSVHSHDWQKICGHAGIDYLSPQGDARNVIRRLAAARLVLAESMHAAIIADAFRVPWRPFAISHQFNPGKWADWASSLDLTLNFSRPIWRAARRLKGQSGEARPGRSDATPRRPSSTADAKLRTRVKDRLLAYQLRALCMRSGQTSSTVVLNRRKALLRMQLAELMRNF